MFPPQKVFCIFYHNNSNLLVSSSKFSFKKVASIISSNITAATSTVLQKYQFSKTTRQNVNKATFFSIQHPS